MKKHFWALTVLCFFLFSGCSFNFKNPEDLIKPPRPGGELAGLQETLQANVGKNILLKNPKNGANSSAYTLCDIDNDGMKEAVAFYKLDSLTSGLHMSVLRKNGADWEFVCEFSDLGNDVTELFFEDLNGDGVNEIILKCEPFDSKQYTVFVYSYLDMQVMQLASLDYTDMTVSDIDFDGMSEVLLLDLNANERSSQAELYELTSDNAFLRKGNAILDGNISGYASIQVDALGYIYVDCYTGNDSMITEILYWNGNTLTAPLMNKEIEGLTSKQTLRTVMMTSQDINGDGIIEIPRNSYMAGQANKETKDIIWLTTWYQYNPEHDVKELDLRPVLTGAINVSDSYMFVFPADWAADVTVVADAQQRTWTFYRWNAKEGVTGAELLSIMTLTRTQWDKGEVDGYTMLKEKGNLIYAVRLSENVSERALSFEQVEENLIILN